jgi:hypothetical protein
MKMTSNIKEYLQRTIELARARSSAYSIISKRGETGLEEMIRDKHSPEYNDSEAKKDALTSYLNSLDFECVKDIQTIMYLGRDEDFEESDSYQKRFEEARKYFDEAGWNKKNIEVHQMTEKLPLAEYLANGMKILNIK